jgi:phthiocerol/phenolphthiocerol synthesis type-I polyketide synthase E
VNDASAGRPANLHAWLTARVAATAGIDLDEIDPDAAFSRYAIGSIDAVGISGDLSDLLDRTLSPTLLYQHPTINALVEALTGPAAGAEDAAESAAAAGVANGVAGSPAPSAAPAAPAPAPAPTAGAAVLPRRAADYEHGHDHADDPIVISGMACRFPGGADSPELYWANLVNGVDASAEVPPDRWDARARYSQDPDASGATYTTRGAFVSDLAGFDPGFFGISPREALRMDPQQRMLLEVSWQALENAGIAPDRLRGSRTGVFVGMMPNHQYAKLQQERTGPSVLDDPYLGLGSSSSVAAGRLSYLLDLRGPAVLMDTACSSSLVALHTAVRSLRAGDSDLALVGGVSAILHPDTYSQACRMRMLAPDGRCKTFDAAADGFLLGEGCGVVVLERMSDAIANRHRVLAVVSGSAVNQDGASNGMTAPNGASQVAVIRQALAEAGLGPDAVGFVEAHGSGTMLGDCIEMESLHSVFGPGREPDRPLVVGAVKTNVGHLTGASGMAGLIKTVLILEHGRIPGNLHLKNPNPGIDWSRCRTVLPEGCLDWPQDGRPRVAAVSSFGWSGTNTHVVLQAPAQPAAQQGSDCPGNWHVLPVSARSAAGVRRRVDELAKRIAADPGLRLDDIATTLQSGRSALDHRVAVACNCVSAASDRLISRLDGAGSRQTKPGVRTGVALLLPGTGELREGTGSELYETDEHFRVAFDRCARAAEPLLGLDLREVVYPTRPASGERVAGPEAANRLFPATAVPPSPLSDRLDVAHAAVFAVDYASAALWAGRGIEPTALLGYSLGEYVAAALAGIFDLDDAVFLVVRRAQLLERAPAGAMTTVALAREELERRLVPGTAIAVCNGPMATVAAGPVEAVAALEDRLRDERIAFMRIPTSRAMHSSVLAPVAAELAELVESVPRHAPRIPCVSNLTGDWLDPDQAVEGDYWARHLCSTVRFAEGVETLAGGPAGVLLEAGPGQLASLATQILNARGSGGGPIALPTLPGAADPRSCAAVLTGTLARLWESGVEVDLGSTGCRGQVTTLAGYPFEHKRFWPEPAPAGQQQSAPAQAAPIACATPAQAPAPELYEPHWERVEAPTGRLQGPFLVYADDTGVADRLAARLEPQGGCVLVASGRAYARTGPVAFTVRPDSADDHARVFDELSAEQTPRTVVHLGSVTGIDAGTGTGTDTEPTTGPGLPGPGFNSLLTAVRALSKAVPAAIRLLAVTDGAQAVDEGDIPQAHKALVHGLCLTVPQELPGWTCHEIDLPICADPADRPAYLDRVVDHLLTELGWAGQGATIAWRGEDRFALSYRSAAVPSGVVALREQGVYLITGGLGKVGLSIAAHIATRRAGVRLVLTGRTGLPPQTDWDALLRDGQDQAAVERVNAVKALIAGGADVLVQAADVGNQDSVRDLLDAVHTRFGRINGVVHAAGDTSPTSFATIMDTTPAQLENHFAAKVRGTVVLSEALADEPLDFCLLMSSTSAVLGGLGFTAYSAANAFLDRFAVYLQRRPGGPDGWQSVAWDTWRHTLPQTGQTGLGASLVQHSFTAEQGLRILDAVLGHHGVLVVAQGDLAARIETWVGGEDPFADPDPDGGGVSPDEAEAQLSALWCEALGVSSIGVHENFFELGGNSLIGATLVARMRKILRSPGLPAYFLYQAPTIAEVLAATGAGVAGDEPEPDEYEARGARRRQRFDRMADRPR